jgi:uncharacterized protein
MSTLRVTVDTNILVSHLLVPGGNPSRVLELGRQRRIQLVLSDVILDELERVLVIKLGFDTRSADAAKRTMASVSQVVRPQFRLHIVEEDDSDNRILECAVAGRASIIISGDRHLLRLERFEELRIVTPGQFLEEWSQ